MNTLRDYFKKAEQEKWAVPHFNFSNLEQLHAIAKVALKLKAPVLAGTSENEREFMGINQVVALVESLRKQGIVIFLNADHCHSVAAAKEAVDAGYDSVHIDLSKESYKDNLAGTKEVVEYAKGKGIDIEGELGYLVTDSSRIYKEEIAIPEESYTKTDEAIEFIKETQIDRLAPAIGTIHGIAANTPSLNIDLAKELSSLDVSLVLHGGSGVSDDDMKEVIKAGFTNIHVSTEVRIAYVNSLKDTLHKMPDELAPYKYLKAPKEAVEKLVEEKMRLFSAVNVI